MNITPENLVALIQSVTDSQKHSEIARENLARSLNFEPYSAFRRLDVHRNGYLSADDLLSFIGLYHQGEISQSERNHLSKLYDLNKDLKITYTDFLEAILPKYNAQLKRDCSQRKSQFVKKQDNLDANVEIGMCEVLLSDINGFRTRTIRMQIMTSPQSSLNWKEVFSLIDKKNKGHFDFEEFQTLLKESPLKILEEDSEIFFNLADFNKDGLISFTEFIEFFLEPYDRTLLKQSLPKGLILGSQSSLSPEKRNFPMISQTARVNPSIAENMLNPLYGQSYHHNRENSAGSLSKMNINQNFQTNPGFSGHNEGLFHSERKEYITGLAGSSFGLAGVLGAKAINSTGEAQKGPVYIEESQLEPVGAFKPNQEREVSSSQGMFIQLNSNEEKNRNLEQRIESVEKRLDLMESKLSNVPISPSKRKEDNTPEADDRNGDRKLVKKVTRLNMEKEYFPTRYNFARNGLL